MNAERDDGWSVSVSHWTAPEFFFFQFRAATPQLTRSGIEEKGGVIQATKRCRIMGNSMCMPRVDVKRDRRLPSAWVGTHEVVDQLGTGMSGRVYKVLVNQEGGSTETVAVKVMPLSGDLLPDEIEDMRRECRILKGLSHPHILRHIDHVEENEHLYLKTEVLNGKELFDFITTRSSYSENDARMLVKTLCKAVKYLHDENITHRDLKPENIILGAKNDLGSMKLVDFGLACKLADPERGIVKAAGTPGYLPPEALTRDCNYGIDADVWSIGVIAYIMLCGYPPFYGESDIELFRDIRRAKVTFDEDDWAYTSEYSKDFVLKLVEKDRKKRLTLAEALKHPWMTTGEEAISNEPMTKAVSNLKDHLAKQRFKRAVKAVIFAGRCKRAQIKKNILRSFEDSPQSSKVRV